MSQGRVAEGGDAQADTESCPVPESRRGGSSGSAGEGVVGDGKGWASHWGLSEGSPDGEPRTR